MNGRFGNQNFCLLLLFLCGAVGRRVGGERGSTRPKERPIVAIDPRKSF